MGERLVSILRLGLISAWNDGVISDKDFFDALAYLNRKGNE